MNGEVILLHGLYMHGIMMQPLARKLQELGWQTHELSYNSLSIDTGQLFETLKQKINGHGPAFLVGHSLGGVLLHRFANQEPLPEGSRVVTLGSPLQGALLAKRLADWKLSGVMGNAAEHGLCHDEAPPWLSDAQLGSLAGNAGLGFGMLLGGMPLDSDHDGTVLVEETEVEGMTDHIVLPVSHTSMLVSDPVAQQTSNFMKYGEFNHP